MAEFEYIAGLIDGEGCICIEKKAPSGPNKTPKYTVTVSVEMGDEEAVQFLHEKFGGHRSSRKRRAAWKRIFLWKVASKLAEPVLRGILPHLKLRRKVVAAQACLNLFAGGVTVSRKLRTPAWLLEKREACYQVCRRANKRGGTP